MQMKFKLRRPATYRLYSQWLSELSSCALLRDPTDNVCLGGALSDSINYFALPVFFSTLVNLFFAQS